MIAQIPPNLRLPAAMASAFAILAVTGLLWTPIADDIRNWIAPPEAGAAPNPKGFVLGTVILLPMLLTVWLSLKLIPSIRKMKSNGLLAILLISVSATAAWRLFGPLGSPDLSYLLALLVSWFILINRPA